MAHKFELMFATTLVLASAGIFGFAFESVAQTSQNVFASETNISAQEKQRHQPKVSHQPTI